MTGFQDWYIENGQTPFCRKKIFLNPFQKKYGFVVFNHFFLYYIYTILIPFGSYHLFTDVV